MVVEHFRDNVAPLLEGRGKAMVVVSSRLEAVRWQIAIDRYIQSQGYSIKTLVAFSGEVRDAQSDPDPFTETSHALNPGLRKRDIREAFATDDYQILLVANKFQTGFDQPLLCGMYVDKRLAGIAAVQTLSRLNRAHPGKAIWRRLWSPWYPVCCIITRSHRRNTKSPWQKMKSELPGPRKTN